MQNLAEFIRRIQTFNLRIITQKEYNGSFVKEAGEFQAYDLTRETQYYDSFSFKSELRVFKDLALIDVLALNKDRLDFLLEQLYKVKSRFKDLWQNYHQHYHDYHQDYKTSYPFTIGLDRLFIINNLQGDSSGIIVNAQFVEDLADSLKLRELFLKELISEIESLFTKDKEGLGLNENLQDKQKDVSQDEATRTINKYPIFTEGTADQLRTILKPYFASEEHESLTALLFEDKAPVRPLVFKGNGNQLADAFKQLFDANLIVGCNKADLEKWIVPKFSYLSSKGELREFTEGYLNGMISTATRPCKSPILKIQQHGNKFEISPAHRNQKIN